MDNGDTTMHTVTTSQRVVEFELRRPRMQEIKLPQVDTEPVRKALEEVALTSIGLAIVAGRALSRTLQAARRAGEEAARNPGPFTRNVLEALGHKPAATAERDGRSIPVLPIADYTALDSEQVIARLAQMGRAQLETLRDFEMEHGKRTAILKAIDGLMETAR